MSRPDSTTSKPRSGSAKSDIYTTLLGITLVAVILSIVILLVEMSRYGWDIKGSSSGRGISQVSPDSDSILVVSRNLPETTAIA